MKELFRRVRNQSRLASEIGVASLVINILGLTSSIYSIVVLRRYLAVGLDSTLVTLTVGAVLAVVFEFALRRIRLSLASGLCRQADRELAEAAFTTLAQSQYGQMSRVGGEQYRELLTGLSTVQQAYAPFNMLTLYDVPFATIYLLALFFISPFLALIAGGSTLFSLAVSWLVQKRMQGPAQRLTRETAAQNATHSTLIAAADSVRQFNWLPVLQEKWANRQTQIDDWRASLQQHQNLAQQLGISSAMLLSILMMGFGSREVLQGNMTVATLIGGNILAGRALSNINRCAQALELFARARQSLETLRSLATLPMEKQQGTTLRKLGGALQLQDVGFMYAGSSAPLFESVSFTLEPGQVLVVQGGNGTGKTTMAKLLVGLLLPQRGEVRLDGVNLQQLQPPWLRRQTMYLPQEPAFFDGTLRENLVCLNSDIDDEKIFEQAAKLGLSSLLETSPEGLDMQLSGGGRSLSLGIRRRLALCRALLGGGAFAVFDEPTEGLDASGCRAVADLLNHLVKSGVTMVIMSNDPFISKAADWCLDLNQKPVPLITRKEMRVKESGTGQAVGQ
jgi:ATP-binding cassette subfamily C protein LapB